MSIIFLNSKIKIKKHIKEKLKYVKPPALIIGVKHNQNNMLKNERDKNKVSLVFIFFNFILNLIARSKKILKIVRITLTNGSKNLSLLI